MISDEQLYSFWDNKQSAEVITCGRVYPDSVMQGYQQGEDIKLGGCRIVWHGCGFVFMYGIPTAKDLVQTAFLMSSAQLENKRFVLFCENEKFGRYWQMNNGVKVEKRYFYEFSAVEQRQTALPEGFEIRRIDAENIGKLDGRIKPSFSWESDESFLKNGVGFCVMHGDTPAAWAFSAAVSDDEIDIGVETLERFRGKGLAAAAASEMIRFSLAAGKKPVWACHAGNIGSQKVAEKLGFEKVGECRTIFL